MTVKGPMKRTSNGCSPTDDPKVLGEDSTDPKLADTPSTVNESDTGDTAFPKEFEETTAGIKEISKSKDLEPGSEISGEDEILPPEEPFEDIAIKRLKEDILREVIETNETIRADYKEDMEILQNKLKEIMITVEKKDELIKVLSTKNIDLINMDLDLISNELRKSRVKLNNIATIRQFDRISELERTKGVNMAYKVSKLYLEDAGMEARLTIPTLNLIEISLEKISEKLRYAGDDDE
jgi:hypothetical protein